MFGAAARAYVRYGFLALRFAPFVEAGPVHPGDAPMLHHPPLLPIALGGAVAVLGEAEWVIRLLPSLASLAALALFYRLARRVDRDAAPFATLAMAAVPMFGVWAGSPLYDVFTLPFQLGAYLLYLRYRETGAKRELAVLAGVLFVGLGFDWFAAFVAAPIGLDALLRKPRAPAAALVVAATGVLFAAAFCAYGEAVQPGTIAELFRAAHHRTSERVVSDYSSEAFTLGTWLLRQGELFLQLYTPIGLALAAAGAFLARRSPVLRHAALLAPLALLPAVIFPQGSYQHAYTTYALVVPLALLIGFTLAAAARRHAALATAIALGFACVAIHDVTAEQIRARWLDTRYRDLGRVLGAAVPFEDAIATTGEPYDWRPVRYYADRVIVARVTTPAALDDLLAHPGPVPVRHVLLTGYPDHLSAEGADLLHALRGRARPRVAPGFALLDLADSPPAIPPSER